MAFLGCLNAYNAIKEMKDTAVKIKSFISFIFIANAIHFIKLQKKAISKDSLYILVCFSLSEEV
jgi:hypothetical protein